MGMNLFAPIKPNVPLQDPMDSTECVFMGRALHELGKAKYGAAWIGDEPTVQLPKLLPSCVEQPFAANWDEATQPALWFDQPPRQVLEYAHDLVLKFRPDLQMKRVRRGIAAGLVPLPIPFTVREWKAAQAIVQAAYDESREAFLRYLDLLSHIVSLCEAGILETKLRPLTGGAFSPSLPTSHWNTEHYVGRFVSSRMHPDQPFCSSAPYNEMHWIFVTRKSLKASIIKLKPVEQVASSVFDAEEYVSDYRQHMAKVSRHMNMQPDPKSQPKRADVEKVIRDLWKGTEPLGKVAVKYMATFIRSPECKGKNTK
jgi:hypothetical protein